MRIERQKIYSRQLGYNRVGFLTNPILAEEKTLDDAIGTAEDNKRYWKKHKSAGSLIGAIKSGINGKIAKSEKIRRKKRDEALQGVIDQATDIKEKIFREKVPEDIAEKGRQEGVIQKDRKGSWRIISYKKSSPEFWDAHYKTRKDAESALGAYHASK